VKKRFVRDPVIHPPAAVAISLTPSSRL
jgi:hypothetical protein